MPPSALRSEDITRVPPQPCTEPPSPTELLPCSPPSAPHLPPTPGSPAPTLSHGAHPLGIPVPPSTHTQALLSFSHSVSAKVSVPHRFADHLHKFHENDNGAAAGDLWQ